MNFQSPSSNNGASTKDLHLLYKKASTAKVHVDKMDSKQDSSTQKNWPGYSMIHEPSGYGMFKGKQSNSSKSQPPTIPALTPLPLPSGRELPKSSPKKRSMAHDDDKYGLSKRACTLSIERSFKILKATFDTKQIIESTRPFATSDFFGCGYDGRMYAKEWTQEEKKNLVLVANRYNFGKGHPLKRSAHREDS